MDRRSEQRVEEPEGGKHDAERIDADRTSKILPDDTACLRRSIG